MQAAYQLNSKTLFLTYPQCDVPLDELLQELRARLGPNHNIEKYAIAKERHANGDQHRHCFLRLGEPLRTRDPRHLDVRGHHGNYQGCRSAKNVLRYCTKDDDFISNFDVGAETAKPNNRRKIGERIIAGESLKTLVGEYPELIFGYKRLKQDVDQYLCENQVARESEEVRGIWIYGKPGVGKSFIARKRIPEEGERIYIKSQNKWWDGYTGEDIVILDDFDSNQLGHLLKIWADRYPCFGETKGGLVPLCHRKIIITSNYHPEDLFEGVMLEAIVRRFTVKRKTLSSYD